MKKWNNAEIVTVDIEETAYGKNEHAKEANANNGHKNNGAGGSLNIIPEGDKSDDTVTPADNLS